MYITLLDIRFKAPRRANIYICVWACVWVWLWVRLCGCVSAELEVECVWDVGCSACVRMRVQGWGCVCVCVLCLCVCFVCVHMCVYVFSCFGGSGTPGRMLLALCFVVGSSVRSRFGFSLLLQSNQTMTTTHPSNKTNAPTSIEQEHTNKAQRQYT